MNSLSGESKEERTDQAITVFDKVAEALTFSLFQNKSYVAICFNNILVTFGLSVIYVHLGSYGLSMGLNHQQATALFSVMGISNMIGRFSWGLLGQLPCVSGMSIYTGGFFLSSLAVASIPFCNSLIGLLVCSGCIGLFTGCLGIGLAQVCGFSHTHGIDPGWCISRCVYYYELNQSNSYLEFWKLQVRYTTLHLNEQITWKWGSPFWQNYGDVRFFILLCCTWLIKSGLTTFKGHRSGRHALLVAC